MQQSIVIRKALEADLPAILQLMQEFARFQQTPEKLVTTLPQMKKDFGLFQSLVAEAEAGELVAFASYFLAYYSWSGRAMYLDDLYVKAAYRKRGIGSALLRQARVIATETGCVKMRWQVSRWNLDAISFYKSMGAAVDDVEVNCDLPL